MSNETDTVRQSLEERMTYCEHLVDTLNDVVTDLQKRVLTLERRNRELLTELRQQQEESSRVFGAANEKPPHY